MKSSPAFKILSAVVLAAVVLYFGVQIYQYFASPFSTTLTYEAVAEDSIPLTGWIVRDEETFHSDAMTLTHALGEGQRVGVGQTMAMAYQSEQALETVTEMETLELQLQQLEFALTSYLDADASLKLDNSITGSILSLRQTLSDGDYAAAGSDISALKAAVLKSSHSYTSVEEVQAEIESVQQRLDRLNASLSGAQSITAPASGTYSAVCDGYESVLTPDFLVSLMPADLRDLSAAENDGNVGKLIYGDTWYYAAAISASLAEDLRAGQTVMLRLAKGLSQDVTARIQAISPEENGQIALVLSCTDYLSQTTQLRHQAAELVLSDYSGLRVPATALRLDENGSTGVYCVVGISARFKPVTVVYRGDGYALVRPEQSAAGTAILRAGDEIIITANKLDNGVVVR
ncbi:MAG: hypothetical protein E7426_03290 [Ruminococcaceae bacterium]|jgi:hypothetical protein|nr:hypothetical protein [Oscillospiraceae bacterium]